MSLREGYTRPAFTSSSFSSFGRASAADVSISSVTTPLCARCAPKARPGKMYLQAIEGHLGY